MIKRVFLLVALLFVLIGCVSESDVSASEDWNVEVKTTLINTAYFVRVVDVEASVVCYLNSANSIDCMPLSDTSLDY